MRDNSRCHCNSTRSVLQQANDVHKEAECYQEIGLICEKQGDMAASIEYLTKFLILLIIFFDLVDNFFISLIIF